MTFALMPPYVIPSRTPRCPPALVRYVLARIPPPATPVPRNQAPVPVTSAVTIPIPSSRLAGPTNGKVAHTEAGFAMPLSMPTMPAMPSMNFGLDMKNVKWGWPGYLTFGKGTSTTKASPSSPSSIPASLAAVVEPPKDLKTPEHEDGLTPDLVRKAAPDVDTASLLEAISTESIGSYTRAASPAPSALSKSSQLESSTQTRLNTGGNVSPVDDVATRNEGQGEHITGSIPDIVHSPPPSAPLEVEIIPRTSRSFLASSVHLAHSDDVLATQKKRVLHLTVCDTFDSPELVTDRKSAR